MKLNGISRLHIAAILLLLLGLLALQRESANTSAAQKPSTFRVELVPPIPPIPEKRADSCSEAMSTGPLADHFVHGELLVKFKTGVSEEERSAFIARKNLTTIREIEALRIRVVAVPAGAEAQFMRTLSQCSEIEYAEPDVLGQSCQTPNDPYYPNQWHLPKTSAPAGWDISTGAATIPIAVLDTGFDPTDQDIGSKLLSGYNSADGTSNTGYTGNAHGTVVSSLAAGRGNDGYGSAGVAWQNPIFPVKIFDSAGNLTISYAASGITWAADHGARVMNMSWIFYWSPPPQALIDAVSYAVSKGVVLVAAAGNDNTTYLQGTYPPYPQSLPNVLTVAATDTNDARCTYSNFGSYVGIAAPSGASLTTGTGAVITSGPGGGSYWATGTSMSSPQVAGLAALVLSVNPKLSNTQVINLIEKNADDLGTVGWDQYYGYGRINISRTLSAAKSTLVPVITSPLAANATVGTAFGYTITATNTPNSFNATGLPAGLTVNTATGVISGTPTATGTSNVTISATNANGTGSATLSLAVNSNKPVISSPLTASGTVNVAFSYTITATNTPTSYNATGLPAGLTVNTATGVISGTPGTFGTSSATISATNAAGTGTATLTLSINAVPVITSAPTATPNPALAGQSVAFSVAASDANGDALSYAWQFGDGTNGSGSATSHTYSATGAFTAVVVISDGKASATGSVSVTVNPSSSLHVASIVMSLVTTGGNSGKAATAKVAIVNAGGAPVGGAVVSGNWSGLTSASVSGTTAADGTVTFTSVKTKQKGTFTFTVGNVSAAGYAYDSSKNSVTSESITTSGVVGSAVGTESATMTSTDGPILLATVTVNQPFNLTLTQAKDVRTTASAVPSGVRVKGNMINGRLKQAGSYTFTAQFTNKTAVTVPVSQEYVITVLP